MLDRRVLARLVASIVVCLLAQSAIAQDDCQCDCYFSFDCDSGSFCDYGSSFTIEDECWWRTPKPNGSVGAGCDQDFGDWGQCDGKCSPTAGAGRTLIADEDKATLMLGVKMWADAMTDTSLRGGGTPSKEWIGRIESIDFNNPSVGYGLWRMMIEVMILTRGADYIIFPEKDGFLLHEVAVADLTGNPVAVRNGLVATEALLREMDEAGTGRAVLQGIDISGLDLDLYSRICDSGDLRECLYTRLADMGEFMGRAQRGEGDGDIQPSCPGCIGDCVPSDEVDIEDLLEVLSEWGSTSYPAADVNQDGIVDIMDLLAVLSSWGECAP